MKKIKKQKIFDAVSLNRTKEIFSRLSYIDNVNKRRNMIHSLPTDTGISPHNILSKGFINI